MSVRRKVCDSSDGARQCVTVRDTSRAPSAATSLLPVIMSTASTPFIFELS